MQFIRDEDEYGRTAKWVGSFFTCAARLPDLVFAGAPAEVGFCEFDDVLDAAFWDLLDGLAVEHGDGEVLLMSIEPDAASYYKKRFGYFGAARLPVAGAREAYERLISYPPEESPADALIYNGRVLAITGASGGFRIWAQRDVELVVVGVFRTDLRPVPALPAGIPWRSAAGALRLTAPTFLNQVVPEGFRSRFVAEYGAFPVARGYGS